MYFKHVAGGHLGLEASVDDSKKWIRTRDVFSRLKVNVCADCGSAKESQLSLVLVGGLFVAERPLFETLPFRMDLKLCVVR